MSSTPNSALADPQQIIADLRRELAASNAERDEALAQQAATAEIVQIINSSSGDLAPVFDAMLEKATRLCEAPFGLMSTYDGQRFHQAASYSVPAPLAEFYASDPPQPGPETGLGRIASGAELVHITDLADPGEIGAGDPRRQRLVELGGVRSYVVVALQKDGRLLGTIAAYRQEVRPFTDRQIALLRNFAVQAVIAMENARLLTQTREALEQQTAAAEVLQVINASPGDLTPVFDAILEKAHTICGAPLGSLVMYDDEHLRAVATRGYPAKYDEMARAGFPARGSPLFDRLTAGEPFIHIADTLAVPLSGSEHPIRRALREIAGVRTLLTVPLRKDGYLRGYISAQRQELRPFTDKEIALLQNFATQAVIAMENARLITETREALEQQTATAEVLQVINSSPGDLTPVFEAMLQRATALCEAAFGTLVTYDGHRFTPVAAHGVPPAFADFRRERGPFPPPPGSSLERVARGDGLVHIADVANDPGQTATPLVKLGGCRALLCVALRKDDALVGAITAYRTDARPFPDKQIALLQNFASQAVIAMENARLITETREALEQQTATAEVLGVINSSPGDLAPVFDAILEKAHSLCGADHGALVGYDGEYFRAIALRAMPEPFAALLREAFRPYAGGVQEGLLAGDPLVHIQDVTGRTPTTPIQQAALDAGIRTLLMVPLRRDDTLLGYITAHRREVRPFTDKQIALLQNFAAQAVIAMENARLLTETREALDRQTATAEVLGIINSSPGNLQPVFEAILEKAMQLCGAAFGAMGLFKGDKYSSVAARGLPEAYAEFRKQHISSVSAPSPSLLVSRVLHGETIIHTLDLKAEDVYVQGEPYRRAIVDLGGARTSLGVALKKDGDVLGAIHLYRQEVRPFADKQIALLQNFAAQAVIAIENARLLGELRERNNEIGQLNRGLEARVAEQVEELGRVGRLKRFLAPQLAELIVSQGDEKILESHRREIVVVFCDLRGYTAFTETAEPEEVLDFLRDDHGALGPLVSQYEGTLDQFSGDGIMVFFNDPVPIPDPAGRAVNMAVAMREAAGELIASWRRRRGRVLGFGVGIAQGYATLGQIGFAERSGYTAIGTVCNLAARLCAEAKDGQILLAQLVAVAVEETTPLEEVGELTLKGLTQPVVAYNVPLAAVQPTLRVIESGGPLAD